MIREITSVQNPRVKEVVRLRERRGRNKQQRFIIDGLREIRRAVEAGYLPHEVYACPELCQTPEADTLWRQLSSDPRIQCLRVSREVFAKLAYGDRSEGLLTVNPLPAWSLASLPNVACPLIVVLEAIEKPGNVGAVLRTAEAAGVDGVLVCDPATDLFNPNLIRASLGAIFSLPICQASSQQALQWLQQREMQICTARIDGAHLYTDVDFQCPTALVLGSEAHGLSPTWQADGLTSLRLPMAGRVDSLNISVAAGILIYEAHRQRSRTCR